MQLSTDHSSPSSPSSTTKSHENLDPNSTDSNKRSVETPDTSVASKRAKIIDQRPVIPIIPSTMKLAPRPIALPQLKSTAEIDTEPKSNVSTINTERKPLTTVSCRSDTFTVLPTLLPASQQPLTPSPAKETLDNVNSKREATPINMNNIPLATVSALSEFDLTQAQQALTQAALTSSTIHTPPQKQSTTENSNVHTDTQNILKDMAQKYASGGTTLEQLQQHSFLTADLLRRELMNQKVRADNRERKKRWREQNEERNKDNDLRCRVNKRAHKLYGKEDSEQKRQWIEEEFAKRQHRRKEKEQRRIATDSSMKSASNSSSVTSHPVTNNGSFGLNIESPGVNLPLLQEAYLSMMYNKDESSTQSAVQKLAEGLRLMGTAIKADGRSEDPTLPQQLASSLQQLYQLLHQSSTESSPKKSQDSVSVKSSTATSSAAKVTVGASTVKSPMNISSTEDSAKETSLEKTNTLGTTVVSSTVSLPYTSPSVNTASTIKPVISTECHEMDTMITNGAEILIKEEDISTTMTAGCELKTKKPSSPLLSSSSSTTTTPAPTPTGCQQETQVTNDELSALLIQTLQQTAFVSQEKQDNMTTPSSPATADLLLNDIPQDPSQLYPMEAIRTLLKLNTEWIKQ
ncbi:uncharacterized protein BX664DRAFT_381247 [Halteromyces radiatus]|uniref:uncharacterized protein n=1 Tax=Halteromyces radiatus TaxID=101107 RepID=UPI00222087D3|nr:uncharacterized protein BX664DRAFT_381247 [Halteromyces radiatus]KAI8098545.1 hypothetical protein BX664DRAFT_381247 [Halteromyces radiatus]